MSHEKRSDGSPPPSDSRIPPGPDRDLLLELLSAKAVSLGEDVTNLLPKMENFLGVSVAILVGGLTLGATDKHPIIFVMLPFPLMVLYVYLLQANTEMLSRAGHKRALEEMVNDLAPQPVLFEETHVAPHSLHGPTHLGRWSIVLIQAVMLALLVGTILLAIVNLDQVSGIGWKGLVATGLALGITMLAAAASEQGAAYRLAYDAAYAGYRGVRPPPSSLLGQSRSGRSRKSPPLRTRLARAFPPFRAPSKDPADFR